MKLCCLRTGTTRSQPLKQLFKGRSVLRACQSHSLWNLSTQCSEFHLLPSRAVRSLFCPISTRPAKCGGPPSRADQEQLSYQSKLFLVVFSSPQSWNLSWQVGKECGPSQYLSNIRALGTGYNCSLSFHLCKHWAAPGDEQPKNLPFDFLSQQ